MPHGDVDTQTPTGNWPDHSTSPLGFSGRLYALPDDTVGTVKCILKRTDPFQINPWHLCTEYIPLIQARAGFRSIKEETS